jgi:IclR family pca regulon transcriptional regulator
VKEIVELSGIPMPTVFRMVATLEEEGFLERTVDGRVRPGTGVLALGFAALQGLDVVDMSSAALRELAELTGETVNLGVLSGDQVLFVARIQRPNTRVAANIRVGSIVPAVFSSIGKVLLAYLGSEDLTTRITEESFAGVWGPKAARSLTQLERQLLSVRHNGYILQVEEAIPGLSSIAAPIRQAGGEVVAAVNLAVPTAEYSKAQIVERLRQPLLNACREISMRLGGSGTVGAHTA